MKRKSYGGEAVKIVKTSISIPEVLMKFAEKECTDEGFNSFSAYLAHLLRMAKERKEDQQKPGQYPPQPEEIVRLEEPPSSSPSPKKGKPRSRPSDKQTEKDMDKVIEILGESETPPPK